MFILINIILEYLKPYPWGSDSNYMGLSLLCLFNGLNDSGRAGIVQRVSLYARKSAIDYMKNSIYLSYANDNIWPSSPL